MMASSTANDFNTRRAGQRILMKKNLYMNGNYCIDSINEDPQLHPLENHFKRHLHFTRGTFGIILQSFVAYEFYGIIFS